MSKAKKWLYKHTEGTSLLLQKLTDVIVDYLVAQVRAGAQVCGTKLYCTEGLLPGKSEILSLIKIRACRS